MTFDWRTQTTLKGTVSRLGVYVHGDCACGRTDVLVYDDHDDATLMCTDCSARRAKANPRVELCDECGATPAWRDPVTRKNEFFCATCHGKSGAVFQNRWADRKRMLEERMSIGMRKAVCAAAGYGTDCKGEIRWRSKDRTELCNKHAGVVSANPANN